MIYFPYAPTCPPLQGYEGARTGIELWQPPERGQKKPKNGKPFQERPSRCRCPRARQPNTINLPTKVRARGHTFLIYLWGVLDVRLGLCVGYLDARLGLCVGYLDGRVGLCAGVIRIKNDNRYGRVQKIDPRNTLRGMKTKETIFLK